MFGTHRARAALLIVVMIASLLVRIPRAEADPQREFILSCGYGVLAGTLVGAASLAFSSKPGDNLNLIARGASIGLYAGIALGLYVIYGGGEGGSDEDAAAALKNTQNQRLQVFPLITQRGFEGAAAQLNVLRF